MIDKNKQYTYYSPKIRIEIKTAGDNVTSSETEVIKVLKEAVEELEERENKKILVDKIFLRHLTTLKCENYKNTFKEDNCFNHLEHSNYCNSCWIVKKAREYLEYDKKN